MNVHPPLHSLNIPLPFQISPLPIFNPCQVFDYYKIKRAGKLGAGYLTKSWIYGIINPKELEIFEKLEKYKAKNKTI